jgi:hypothetical protein
MVLPSKQDVINVLVDTNFDILDVCRILDIGIDYVPMVEEAILGDAEIQHCPTCDLWVRNTDVQWNPHKGCCTVCAVLDG